MPLTLIATGGTIASTRSPTGAVTTTLSGADLLEGVPGAAADVEVVDLSVPGSWNMSGEHASLVAHAARSALEAGSSGVVITHGTDVLEETAFLTELLARETTRSGPIVFAAAMRHASELGGDGPRNLADALAVAAHPAAADRGVLVCLGGEIHHARWVVKTHSTALRAFESPGRAPVGEAAESGIRFTVASPPAPPRPPRSPDYRRSVPILTSHWDADPELVDWHLARGAQALVVEAGGAGNVNGGLVAGLTRALDRGVPVVIASRCRGGRVVPIYGGAGGFATLSDAGAVGSAGLPAGKARLAVQTAMSEDPSQSGVRRYFAALDDER